MEIRRKSTLASNLAHQTIEGLKARLADFYLLDSINGKIEIAVMDTFLILTPSPHHNQHLIFTPTSAQPILL